MDHLVGPHGSPKIVAHLFPRRRHVGIPVAGDTAQDAHGDGILVLAQGDHLQLEVLALVVSLEFGDPYYPYHWMFALSRDRGSLWTKMIERN